MADEYRLATSIMNRKENNRQFEAIPGIEKKSDQKSDIPDPPQNSLKTLVQIKRMNPTPGL